jgi:hypothetical protein
LDENDSSTKLAVTAMVDGSSTGTATMDGSAELDGTAALDGTGGGRAWRRWATASLDSPAMVDRSNRESDGSTELAAV